jgi:hypothetical protein
MTLCGGLRGGGGGDGGDGGGGDGGGGGGESASKQRTLVVPSCRSTIFLLFSQSHAAHSAIRDVSGLHQSSHPEHSTPRGESGREQSLPEHAASSTWRRGIVSSSALPTERSAESPFSRATRSSDPLRGSF